MEEEKKTFKKNCQKQLNSQKWSKRSKTVKTEEKDGNIFFKNGKK